MKDQPQKRQLKKASPYEKNIVYTPSFLKVRQDFLDLSPDQARRENATRHEVSRYHIMKSTMEWYDTVRTRLYHRLQANPYKQKGTISLGSCTYEVFKLFELEENSPHLKKSSTWRTNYRDGETIVLPQLKYKFVAPNLPILANPRWCVKHYRKKINEGTENEEVLYYRLRYVSLCINYDFDFRVAEGNFLYVCENWNPVAGEWRIA